MPPEPMDERAILVSLRESVNELNCPDTLSILDIDGTRVTAHDATREYIARYETWSKLINISKSIPDLLKQPDHIALVGFLGHFSSGKSSLINALLKEGPEGYQRDTGQHPTDTQITLIAHPKHDELMRQSPYSTIDDIVVETGPVNEFLDHATLVDTPGLGNEAQEQETVTRFLHLCHVLVLTIDGRRPFADKDKDFELLDIAFNRLRGVPKVLVVTSAEEFLASRQAEFATGWQQAKADTFWEGLVQRLAKDQRFAAHLDVFQSVPRIFVDSKEGFRIDELKRTLRPIVTDDNHRSRAKLAQARYVLNMAGEALAALYSYISTRSDKLNRLQTEAQRRAYETETAVDQLLQSLDAPFGQVMQRLVESRQRIPSASFALAEVVTPQAIDQLHGDAVRELESSIRGALRQRLADSRKSVRRHIRRHFGKRTRRWFRTKGDWSLQVLIDRLLVVSGEMPTLTRVVTTCGRTMLSSVNQQLTSMVVASRQHLDRPSEELDILWSMDTIKASLRDFSRTYDDGIRAFYAFVSQPTSIDLLSEHGVVGFDEFGEQAVQTESIKAQSSSDAFDVIRRTAEVCSDRLWSLHGEKTDDELTVGSPDDDAESEPPSTIERVSLGESYRERIASRIARICREKTAGFVASLSDQMNEAVSRVDAERAVFVDQRGDIWMARLGVAWRLLLALILLGAGAAIVRTVPSISGALDALVTENLVEGAVGGAILMALAFVLTGGRNENLRQALQPVTVRRLKYLQLRRKHATALDEVFRRSYDQLIEDLETYPLQVDQAIVSGVVDRVQSNSVYRRTKQELSELRKSIQQRCELLDEFIRAVNEHLNQIPEELRERAANIKEKAVEEHLARIRSVVSSVDRVKSKVDRAAQIAASHPK